MSFAAGLLLACLNQCYALLLVLPFGAAELWYAVRERRIRYREWMTLAVPAALAAISYIPLLHAYRAVLGTSGVGGSQFVPRLSRVFGFYTFALAPCWLLVVAAVAFYAIRLPRGKAATEIGRFSAPELALTLTLLALPAFGVTLAWALRAQYFGRYVIGAIAGCVLLLALGLSHRSRRIAALLAVFLVFYAAGRCLETVRLRLKNLAEYMVEPDGSDFVFSRNPSDPLEPFAMLRKQATGGEPIVVRSILDFLYLIHYAPAWRSRLYSVSPAPDIPYKLERAAREWCHIDFNREQLLPEFLAQHHDFAVYGTVSEFPLLQAIFESRNALITSFKWGDNRHFYAQVHLPAK